MEEFKQKLNQIALKAQTIKKDQEFNSMYKPMIEFMERRMINAASKGEVKAVFKFRQRSPFEYFIQTGEEDALYFESLDKLIELFDNQFHLKPIKSENHQIFILEYCWA